MTTGNVNVRDAVTSWRDWQSGSVDELAAIGTAFVWSLGLEPLRETAANDKITRRTIRYYIANGLVEPPEGERRLATYQYRHLLQILYVKARQHAGDRLTEIGESLSGRSGSALEELTLSTLPQDVPPPVPDDPAEFRRPAQLSSVLRRWAFLTGREGRWGQSSPAASVSRSEPMLMEWKRDVSIEHEVHETLKYQVQVDLGDGLSLTIPADHPLVHDEDGRSLFLRGVRRLIRQYRRGIDPAERKH